uniref:Uncharacterized protein n=1 Tax=Octactis speculum TaxID=3111310 RepID=A0A7S2ARJ6_9STRA|mmetsp:Transcript_1431/g.1775  ORF Transcript_1431/g.1775 Transcript_1431/m.1775 type:complete len:295 (+) Transcript_1431:59-943(+)
MRGQTKTKTVSGQHYAKRKLGKNPRQNSERIWQRERLHEEFGDSKGIWSFTKQVARLVQELSSIKGISKISVREDGIDVFFVKKTQQKNLCPKQHESTERLDLMQRAFENESLESKVLKTWTPPKDNACERKWKRFYRRLCDSMEKELEKELAEVKVGAGESSGEDLTCTSVETQVEAVEPSGEDLTSTSVENPSLNCGMEKTETEKPSGEGADFCDGSDSNDESLEPENELRRGSEEQPVRQGGFVQQPAKQEAVPRASEQKVFKEVDELEKEVWRMLNGIVDRWEKSTGKKF